VIEREIGWGIDSGYLSTTRLVDSMNRRGFVGVVTAVTLSGCSDVSEITDAANQQLRGTQSLGETVSFGEVDVTVTETLTAGEVTTYIDSLNGESRTTHTAPSNGKFALFSLSVTIRT
jgi:hypothetical protein